MNAGLRFGQLTREDDVSAATALEAPQRLFFTGAELAVALA